MIPEFRSSSVDLSRLLVDEAVMVATDYLCDADRIDAEAKRRYGEVPASVLLATNAARGICRLISVRAKNAPDRDDHVLPLVRDAKFALALAQQRLLRHADASRRRQP
jgi:hypothetical protein